MLSSFKRSKMGQKMSSLSSRNPVSRSCRDSDESCEKQPRMNNNNGIEDVEKCQYSIPFRLSLLLDTSPPEKSLVDNFTWNSSDKSLNIIVLPDNRICRRLPVAQSTDCIRGNKGFASGLHVWEIEWEVKQRGTHAMIGVATRDAPLHCPGYRSLIGSNKESWGWDLGRSKLLHDCLRQPPRTYPKFSSTSVVEDIFSLTDCIKVVLDMDAGTLAFMAGNIHLGVAFSGLKGLTLYPIISAVWGHCEVKIRYINSLNSEVCSLKEMARHVIRKSCRDVSNNNCTSNPISNSLYTSGIASFTTPNPPTIPSSSISNFSQYSLNVSRSSYTVPECLKSDDMVNEGSIHLLPLPLTLKQYLLC